MTTAMNRLAVIALTLLIGSVTQSVEGAAANQEKVQAPPTPVFADNYHVHGLLSLPYAELNEPFNAYYDKQLERSRADYYGGEYKVYQFGPQSTPDPRGSQFGSIFKFVYVPKGFKEPPAAAAANVESAVASHRVGSLSSLKSKSVVGLLSRALDYASSGRFYGNVAAQEQPSDDDDGDDDFDQNNDDVDVHVRDSKTPIKRVCFGVTGGVGFTVRAQTVLPDLHDFAYDSTGRCPYVAGGEHRKASCELWKYTNEVGSKKNSYKFWVRRDETNSSVTIPVHYYMLGFDSLLGSHYDRYDISYWNYRVGGARDQDFRLEEATGNKCGPMPGPGDSSGDSGAVRRAHLSVHNPIHQYVETPHRYDHIDRHYEEFKALFGKSQPTAVASEQADRRGWFNFLHNLRFIHARNRQLKEFKLAVNKFADAQVVGGDELRYLRGRLHSTGYNGGLDYAQHHGLQLRAGGGKLTANDKPLPETYDWTVLGAVTPVKDQAVCGSCWSFGTVGTVEGNYFAKTGKLLRLSQQQLVDCSWQYGNNGCDGGEDFRAYAYIQKAGGLATEEDYGHYKGIDGKCHDQDVARPVRISGFYNVTTNSVEALQHAIVSHGPVSVSIDASRPTFTFYSHGAYFDEKCANSPDSLDHSVLVVGYTRINDKLVWKVKNSWSTYWGNDGYIYMLAEGNNCGVLDAPTVPIIAN